MLVTIDRCACCTASALWLMATLSRRPTAAEQAACRRLLAEAPTPQIFYEDLLWSLLNSKPFLFVR
jgi:hypothetical protein